jgi:hypothetical protein
MKLYIAGPMTGVPQFNVPLFDRVADELRAQKYDVVSPAELDSPEMRAAAMQSADGALAPLEKATKETWGQVLARDVRVLSDQGIEGIVLLPGWERSRGANLEATVGLLNGLKFFLYDGDFLSPVGSRFVLTGIQTGFYERGQI